MRSENSAMVFALPATQMQRAIDLTWALFLAAAVFLLVQAIPGVGHAANTSLQDVICGVAMSLKNGTGPIIATIAVAILGVGAMLGKTSWTMALTTAAGIAVLLGADQILRLLFGAKYTQCVVRGTATDLSELNMAMCHIAASLTGNEGGLIKGIAIVAINLLGFAAFYGRLSWGTALAVGVAIGVTFGAVGIVEVVYGVQKGSMCASVVTGGLLDKTNLGPTPWLFGGGGGGGGTPSYNTIPVGNLITNVTTPVILPPCAYVSPGTPCRP